MSLNVLTQGGGTGGETASIFVTGLSEADTVTATKNGKTITAKWNGDGHSITIKDYGMWTVTATNGEDTTAQDVLVDAAMDYEIDMGYRLWLYREGDECEDVTGGWISVNPQSGLGWSMGTATKNSSNLHLLVPQNTRGIAVGWTIQEAINVTQHTKLNAVVTANGTYNRINLYTGTVYADTSIAAVENVSGARTEISIDISAVTGEYKVHCGCWDAGVGCDMTIHEVWLE